MIQMNHYLLASGLFVRLLIVWLEFIVEWLTIFELIDFETIDLVSRYEWEKYSASLEDVRHMLDDRLQQWSEYEGTFDRLLTWLCETETSLKDYVPRSSLEQKEEQMEKYQVTTSTSIT